MHREVEVGDILDVLAPEEQEWECTGWRPLSIDELKSLFDAPYAPLLRRTSNLIGVEEICNSRDLI